jgi:hypothetical protein
VRPERVRLEQVQVLWEEGAARLRASEGAERLALERVVDALADELRRRLGATYTADELARHYVEHGVDWCLQTAMQAAPTDPEAWDVATVAGAAFARLLRGARDYGGGGRRAAADDEQAR